MLTQQEYTDLDRAVAQAEIAAGQLDIKIDDDGRPFIQDVAGAWEAFRPSVHWGHAGSIIERDGIAMRPAVPNINYPSEWIAAVAGIEARGPTPLVAAMRVYQMKSRSTQRLH